MLSVHTSPLDQPGGGDAGGMNVYIIEVARRLAERNIEVEIFTRATSSKLPPLYVAGPGVLVRHVPAGPYEGLSKSDLPAQLCAFSAGVLRAEAARDPGWYDLVHSHYWLSGHVGWLAKERWGVPLVHSMHTMAKVKNLLLAEGDTPEPRSRIIGEEQVVQAADRLVANTAIEASQLIDLYDAEPSRVRVVYPGVDLSKFSAGSAGAARARLGVSQDAVVLLFAGRIQPLKAPDVLVRAAALLLDADPSLRDRLVVALVGAPSGSGLEAPEGLAKLATDLGVADIVRFEPPVSQDVLADWYRAADLTVVPSYSESFGLVAVESQACGTPVLATGVGGLCTSVRDGHSGVLLDGHDPAEYAAAVGRLLRNPAELARLSEGAVRHAQEFSWEATVDDTVEVYVEALAARRDKLLQEAAAVS